MEQGPVGGPTAVIKFAKPSCFPSGTKTWSLAKVKGKDLPHTHVPPLQLSQTRASGRTFLGEEESICPDG